MAVEEHISHIRSGLTYQLSDRDPEETQEWMDSFDSLVEEPGHRACPVHYPLAAAARRCQVRGRATRDHHRLREHHSCSYQEREFPGDEAIERRYRAFMRWNAAIMVHRAQNPAIGVGGQHLHLRRCSDPV